MTENELANKFLATINRYTDDLNRPMSQEESWELSQQLAALAQPRKSFQKLYNSKEGRKERKELAKKGGK